MEKTERILIDYEETNDKYYVYINGKICGKYYSLSTAIGSLLTRECEEFEKI